MRETEKRPSRSQIDRGSLKRVLSLGDLFAVGYGDLGSSIYYALGITVMFSLGAAPLSLLLAGMVFACTAFSYAELSSMVKETGGSLTYTRRAFNDLVSFVAGWALLLDFIVTIAISSCSVAPYLSFFLASLKKTEWKLGCTVCLIAFLFVINLRGTKGSAKMSRLLTIFTLCTQFAIILIGAFCLVRGSDLFAKMRINVPHSPWSPSWREFWKGTTMAMVAYTGIESMAQLSGEVKKPARTVPRAILLAMGILLIVYLGTSVIALAAVTPEVLGTTYAENPIAGIVSALPFGGKVLGPWVGILGAVILFVASNAGLIGASRLACKMGENYQIPRCFYRMHPTFGTPYITLALFSLLAICIVLASRGKLSFLADLYNFGAMLAFFMTHLSLVMLRIRSRGTVRSFTSPGNIRVRGKLLPLTAIIGGIVTFGAWTLVVISKPEGRYLGIIWMGVGLALYLFYRKNQELHPMSRVKIENIPIPEYTRAAYRHILVPTRGGKETLTVQMACEIAKRHGAEVTALYVIEVPFSLSLTSSYASEEVGEAVLKRAEAIAREFGITVRLRTIRARSIEGAIIDVVEQGGHDLLVMGAGVSFGRVFERVCGHVSCSVCIYRGSR